MKCVEQLKNEAQSYDASVQVDKGGMMLYVDLPDDKVWKASDSHTLTEPAQFVSGSRWSDACKELRKRMDYGTREVE